MIRFVRWIIAQALRLLYARLFRTKVAGARNIPSKGGVLVVANHTSHLDMGLIKHGLGAAGRDLMSLAAKDYFFDHPLKSFFFSNFTNLVAFNRRERLKESLRAAGDVLASGRNLLIFPEGTRTKDGRMGAFKPSVGFLALNNDVDVLPVYLAGAFEAFPKGALLPRRLDLAVTIGAAVPCAELKALTRGMPNNEAYRAATARIEEAVRSLGERKPAEAASARTTV